jgi:hypothetical protein
MSSVNIVGVEPRLSLLEAEVDEIESGGGGGGGDSLWVDWPEYQAIKPKNSKYVGVPNSTNTSGSLISPTAIAVATPNEGRAITAVPLTRGDNVIAERDLNTDDFDLVDAKIVIKDRAVPITVTNDPYTSTIDNAGNYVTMNISEQTQLKSSFEITPNHILLNAPCVDFPFALQGQSAYFRLKFDPDSGSIVYSMSDPQSAAEVEIYKARIDGTFIINRLLFKNQDKPVTSCLPEPQFYHPMNIPGDNNVTEIIQMTPVSITVNSALDFRMNFDISIRNRPFSANILSYPNVEMSVYVQWTDGNYQYISWYIGIHSAGVASQAYSLTDSTLPYIEIKLDSDLTLSSVEEFRIKCAGATPVYF